MLGSDWWRKDEGEFQVQVLPQFYQGKVPVSRVPLS